MGQPRNQAAENGVTGEARSAQVDRGLRSAQSFLWLCFSLEKPVAARLAPAAPPLCSDLTCLPTQGFRSRARTASALTSRLVPWRNQRASVAHGQPLAAAGSEPRPRQVEPRARCDFLLEMSSGKVTEARGVELGVQLLQKPRGDNISPVFPSEWWNVSFPPAPRAGKMENMSGAVPWAQSSSAPSPPVMPEMLACLAASMASLLCSFHLDLANGRLRCRRGGRDEGEAGPVLPLTSSSCGRCQAHPW